MTYTPGDITKPIDRHSSHKSLVEGKEQKRLNVTPKFDANELYTEKHECLDDIAPLEEKKNSEKEHLPHVLGSGVPDNLEAIENCTQLIENEEDNSGKMRIERPIAEKPTERNVPEPIVPAFCNFLTARKMAQENLEHQPLPDAIMDLAFRKLQAQGALNPGLALDVIPIATGNC